MVVSDGSTYACFYKKASLTKRSQSHTLEDARSQQAIVIMPRSTRPCRADDDNRRPKQVQVPFPPNSRRSDEDEARDANAPQMPTSQQGYIGEGARRRFRGVGRGGCIVEEHEGEGVCGQQRREGGRDDGAEAEDCGYQVSAPEGVVEGVSSVVLVLLWVYSVGISQHTIRVIAWLWH
jgi:hypothetical protein